ncbi:MAG: DNA repair protein RadC [Paludibacteraceae bacterium]|nr:DNA repair protein RadC [Paludibacteraceae bacterium]
MEKRKLKELDTELQPREKLKKYGVRSLTDVELLAIMLRSGIPGKNVLELSSEIMDWSSGKWGTLTNLSLYDMVRQFNGLGEVKAMQMIAALEVGRRRSVEFNSPDKVKGSLDVVHLLHRILADLDVENFFCVYLSNSNAVIATQRISTGGLTAVNVDVRVVMRYALSYNATGIILAHNHPSGNVTPSGPDKNLTERLSKAAALLDIRLLDHVILSSDPNNYFSFSDNCLL